MAKILVVDDEMGIRELLREILEDENHDVLLAANAAAARIVYEQTPIDLVLLDIWMPDIDGMSLLREWVGHAPLRCPVVMMSGHASIDTALEANSLGAAGFLEKPITLQRLLSTVQKLISRSSPMTSSHDAHSNAAQQGDALPDQQPTASQGTSWTSGNPHLVAEGATASSHTSNNLSAYQLSLSQLNLDSPLRVFREACDKIYFENLLDQSNYSITRVSEISGLERTHLYRKFKQLGIEAKRKHKLHS